MSVTLRFTITGTYQATPEHYRSLAQDEVGALTPMQMAKLDEENQINIVGDIGEVCNWADDGSLQLVIVPL